MTAPGFVARPSGRASASDGLPVAVDPSTASFRALALQVRAMGLLDRRPGYYRVKITLTIFAFFAGWALFVIVGDSWAVLAVAPLVGMMFTHRGWHAGRRRSSSPSCCCEAAACTYSGSSGSCGDETMPRR
jgi:hypothetical protein